MRTLHLPLEAAATEAGEQTLVPGVRPAGLRGHCAEFGF